MTNIKDFRRDTEGKSEKIFKTIFSGNFSDSTFFTSEKFELDSWYLLGMEVKIIAWFQHLISYITLKIHFFFATQNSINSLFWKFKHFDTRTHFPRLFLHKLSWIAKSIQWEKIMFKKHVYTFSIFLNTISKKIYKVQVFEWIQYVNF